MTGLCLDTGALIAVERGSRRVMVLTDRAVRGGLGVHVVPEVVAQAWRGGARQARLAAFLSTDDLRVPAYDAETARAVGRLAATSGHHDVIDVHVVLHALVHDLTVLTSDPDDLRAVHPAVRLVRV